MKTLVVGGTQDFGKRITEHFAPDSLGIGRTNGYDVTDPKTLNKIVEMSLDFDLVVVVTNAGLTQPRLVDSLAQYWLDRKHSGYLMCLGSTAIYHNDYRRPTSFWKHIRSKKALQGLGRYISKKTASSKNPMRFTNIQVGRLDNEKAKAREGYTNGIRSEDLCSLIRYLYESPQDLAVHEIALDPKY